MQAANLFRLLPVLIWLALAAGCGQTPDRPSRPGDQADIARADSLMATQQYLAAAEIYRQLAARTPPGLSRPPTCSRLLRHPVPVPTGTASDRHSTAGAPEADRRAGARTAAAAGRGPAAGDATHRCPERTRRAAGREFSTALRVRFYRDLAPPIDRWATCWRPRTRCRPSTPCRPTRRNGWRPRPRSCAPSHCSTNRRSSACSPRRPASPAAGCSSPCW